MPSPRAATAAARRRFAASRAPSTQAQAGDVIFVRKGVYSPSATGEVLPIGSGGPGLFPLQAQRAVDRGRRRGHDHRRREQQRQPRRHSRVRACASRDSPSSVPARSAFTSTDRPTSSWRTCTRPATRASASAAKARAGSSCATTSPSPISRPASRSWGRCRRRRRRRRARPTVRPRRPVRTAHGSSTTRPTTIAPTAS